MIYPNGQIEIRLLKKYIESDDYVVYIEDESNKPTDWDFHKDGIYRGPQTKINSFDEILPYLNNDNYTICYDLTEKYYKIHAHIGEQVLEPTMKFHWEYNGGTDRIYTIDEEDNSLELCKVDGNNDYKFVIGYWAENPHEDCYEFKSCGDRFFKYINDDDLSIVYNAMKKAEEYLNKEDKND